MYGEMVAVHSENHKKQIDLYRRAMGKKKDIDYISTASC
jgi:hypothetical protein